MLYNTNNRKKYPIIYQRLARGWPCWALTLPDCLYCGFEVIFRAGNNALMQSVDALDKCLNVCWLPWFLLLICALICALKLSITAVISIFCGEEIRSPLRLMFAYKEETNKKLYFLLVYLFFFFFFCACDPLKQEVRTHMLRMSSIQPEAKWPVP